MSELTDLYPAVAAVAAITTAIQTPIVLSTFDECSKSVKNLSLPKGDSTRGNAERDRLGLTGKSILLNFPATVINSCAIVPWGYLVYSNQASTDEWLYYLPWLGVAVSALFLLCLVCCSIAALFVRSWWQPACGFLLVGLVVIYGLVAREIHVWPF